jgi:hypothetical protein
MTSPFDILRSYVHEAKKTLDERLRSTAGPLRAAIAQLQGRVIYVPEADLARQVARVAGASVTTITLREGRLHVHAEFPEGHSFIGAIVAELPTFAPRGPKECIFRVEPAHLVDDPYARSVVGALSAVIARAIWQVLIPGHADFSAPAYVDRDPDGRLRVDLRSIPEVRAVKHKQIVTLAMDALELTEIRVCDRRLELRLGLVAGLR